MFLKLICVASLCAFSISAFAQGMGPRTARPADPCEADPTLKQIEFSAMEVADLENRIHNPQFDYDTDHISCGLDIVKEKVEKLKKETAKTDFRSYTAAQCGSFRLKKYQEYYSAGRSIKTPFSKPQPNCVGPDTEPGACYQRNLYQQFNNMLSNASTEVTTLLGPGGWPCSGRSESTGSGHAGH